MAGNHMYDWTFVLKNAGKYYGDQGWDGRGDGSIYYLLSVGDGVNTSVNYISNNAVHSRNVNYFGYIFAKYTKYLQLRYDPYLGYSLKEIIPLATLDGQIIKYKLAENSAPQEASAKLIDPAFESTDNKVIEEFLRKNLLKIVEVFR